MAMVKVKIRTGRGTGSIEVDVDDLKFSGDEFKKIQAERKKAAGNRMVSTGSGLGWRCAEMDVRDRKPAA